MVCKNCMGVYKSPSEFCSKECETMYKREIRSYFISKTSFHEYLLRELTEKLRSILI